MFYFDNSNKHHVAAAAHHLALEIPADIAQLLLLRRCIEGGLSRLRLGSDAGGLIQGLGFRV